MKMVNKTYLSPTDIKDIVQEMATLFNSKVEEVFSCLGKPKSYVEHKVPHVVLDYVKYTVLVRVDLNLNVTVSITSYDRHVNNYLSLNGSNDLEAFADFISMLYPEVSIEI